MTYREIGYSCLDLLKIASDDSFITLDHCLFLLKKVRALILKQRYSDIKKDIPESNYQTICLDLVPVPAMAGVPCSGEEYLKSIQKIPTVMPIGNTLVYTLDYYDSTITFISRERMRYVGHNKWLKNIIYASLGPDDYLYFKSANPQFLYLEKCTLNAVFEDPEAASELSCDEDTEENCDILDKKFPLEEGLVSTVIELTVKYLSGMNYQPQDKKNNASDELGDIARFIRQNMKERYLKDNE